MFNLVPFQRRNRGLVDLDDFFDDFFNNFGRFGLTNTGINTFRTDIKETENEYIVLAELPGVNKENINIEVDENYMTITAVNDEIIEEEKNNYIRKERRSGRFQRSFNISDVKADEIKAKYENGILEIVLPKAEKGKKSRHIDIN
ncbi:MAG TPA: Hsp20/alpha crystallin family protein [Halanaerobiaceae bacterium]|jgi:HSP20 family protein|nr:Hsp20/alpha crystallin family protein [Bacillota bacterium]HHU93315.1 Hsp20/alpha crystallin family protein [Halanaerobiaceae bacterium]